MASRKYSGSSDALLLLTAIIWGFAFVAQRIGMEHVGPFTFNGIRFLLGAMAVFPMIFWLEKTQPPRKSGKLNNAKAMGGCLLSGIFLFVGASLQQIGIDMGSTAGNAGFITGLYVVFVPVFGIFLGQRTNAGTGLGVILALVGLYLLSVTGNMTMAWCDFLVLVGAFFWAFHVLYIGRISRRMNPGKLAVVQYLVVSLLSLVIALIFESISWEGMTAAAIPILYGGLASVGIAYTLQIVGQRKAHPAHASIILSLEAVFAAFGGWLILGEVLPFRGIVGAGLMLAGMVISQLWSLRRTRQSKI